MLKCNRITKSYQTGIQSVKAVSDVTLEFFRGIHMIKGKSGSGKTTLLRMLGGQQQKVAIGRTLVSGAEVIFADEPTGNLDYESSIQIMNIFRKIKEEKIILMVTHDLELLKFADKVYHMDDGMIQEQR